jgi:hypothetical protein
MPHRLLALALTLLLAGCDLAELMADPKVAQREADAKAIGGACRHAMRSLEDCYALNPKASKAAVFTGWKDMDQYMRDNKIDGIEPKGVGAAAPAPTEEIVSEDTSKDKPASGKKSKSTEKSAEH